MDKVSKEQRSYNMSRIKSKNTRLEIKVFEALELNNLKFLKHYKDLPGKPDVVFFEKKIAVFIDSDFWHGWRFKDWQARLPNSYWLNKISQNIERDRKSRIKLRRMGWKVIRIWEHQLIKNEKRVINKLLGHVER